MHYIVSDIYPACSGAFLFNSSILGVIEVALRVSSAREIPFLQLSNDTSPAGVTRK